MDFFIDLENTLIGCWNENGLLVENAAHIARILKAHKASSVGIFSLVIQNADDRQEFEARLKKDIERALECPVNDRICLFDDLVQWRKQNPSLHLDFFKKPGKETSFIEYVHKENLPDGIFVLIDDMVNTDVIRYKNKTFIFINIADLSSHPEMFV